MTRQFTTPIVLPGDPSASLHATSKSYVDTGLSGKVGTSRQIVAGAGLTGGGALSADRTLAVALVTSTPYSLTYASSITIDPTAGNNPYTTATGAITVSMGSGGLPGQMILWEVAASSSGRAVTLSGITMTTGLSSPITVTSGKTGKFGLRLSPLTSAWELLAYTETV